ncbi:MAG: polysaccharide pyruvyl transferase family protein [Nitrososphaerota archaeon]
MKYGLLIANTGNIGDDIQSLAAKQFLPRVDVYLDRDNLKDVKFNDDKIKIIMNGWFTHRPEKFPPPKEIEPLFISFHVSPHIAQRFLRREVIEYLRQYEPIGCRDIWTMKLLERFGIKAYFSGCLTLTLDYKYSVPRYKENILIIDLPLNLTRYVYTIASMMGVNIKELTHYHMPRLALARTVSNFAEEIFGRTKSRFIRSMYNWLNETIFLMFDLRRSRKIPLDARFMIAETIIQEIASAKFIVTSRFHAALTALAFGRPFVFVPANPKDPRFSGYLEYMHLCPSYRFKQYVEKNIVNTPPLPNVYKLQKLKSNLITTVKNFLSK